MTMNATQQQNRVTAVTRPAEAADSEKLIDDILAQTASKLDLIASRYAQEVENPALGRLHRAMVMAQGVDRLRRAMSGPVMQKIMSLMNTPLGFKTDRGPHVKSASTPYDEDTVREAVIVGLLNGVYPLFNEMNIIAGNCYVTKEGYARKVREIPGLSDLVLSPSTPAVREGKTIVRFAATWKYNGVPGSLKDGEGKPGINLEIPANQFLGPDGIVGKATRKALKRIYEQIMGSEHTLPDGDAEETPTANGSPSAKDLLGKKQPDPKPESDTDAMQRQDMIDYLNSQAAILTHPDDLARLKDELDAQRSLVGDVVYEAVRKTILGKVKK